MGRTRKLDPEEMDEFNDDSSYAGTQQAYAAQADQDGPAELGDPDRRGGFDRLNDEDLFRFRDF